MNTTMDNKASPNSSPCDMDSQLIIPLSDLLLSGEEDINARDDYGRTALMLECVEESTDNAISLIKLGADLEIRDERDEKTALMYACQMGHANVVDLMIDTGVDLNKRDRNDFTALMFACVNGHSSIALSLIKNNACLDARGYNGQTALLMACSYGLLDVMKVMHSKGVDLNVTDNSGNTCLMTCIRCELDVAKFLINQKVDLNAKNNENKTALMLACLYKVGECVDLLLENDVDLEVKDKDGRTALMYACLYAREQEHESIAMSLINHNACFEIRDNNDKTVFMYACQAGFDRVVDLIIKKGAKLDLNDEDDSGVTALKYACRGGQSSVAIKLIKLHSCLDASNTYHVSLLTIALEKGLTRVVKLMLKKGMTLKEGVNGSTSLITACKSGESSLVIDLINRNVCVEEKDSSGKTAFMFACEHGLLEVVKLMLEKGIDIKDKSDSGWTVLHYLCDADSKENCDILKLLLNSGVDINAQTEDGQTAIMKCFEMRCHKYMKMLIEAGADLDLLDADGRSVVFLALVRKCEQCVDVLVRRGNVMLGDKLKPVHCSQLPVVTEDDYYEDIDSYFYELDDPERHILEYQVKQYHLAIRYRIFDWQLCREPDLVSIVPETIKAGMCPGGIVKKKGEYTSPLIKAFEGKNYETVKMILDKLYFFKEDYAKLKRLCRWRTDIESDLVDRIIRQPLKLGEWSFLAVSKLISLTGGPCGRKSRLERSPLPCAIKRKLSFQ